MKEIPLTKGYVAFVSDEDYEELSKHKWTALVMGKNVKRVYAYRRCDWDNTNRRWRKAIYMHRQVFGDESAPDVDHEDHNTLNNQRWNLRSATRSQNLANNRRAKSATGFRGVTLTKRGETAPYRVMFRSRFIGTYYDAVEAARVYDALAIKEFGEFAKLNFPEATLQA